VTNVGFDMGSMSPMLDDVEEVASQNANGRSPFPS